MQGADDPTFLRGSSFRSSSFRTTDEDDIPAGKHQYNKGDRRIIYDPRVGDPEFSPPKPPKFAVIISKVLGLMMIAAGISQLIIWKMSPYKWPLHWMGVLALLLGLLAAMVNPQARRGGPVTTFIIPIGLVAITSGSLTLDSYDTKLYREILEVEYCKSTYGGPFCQDSLCFCIDRDQLDELCLDFNGECENIPDRVHLLLASVVITGIISILATAIVVANSCICVVLAPPEDDGNEVDIEKERTLRR